MQTLHPGEGRNGFHPFSCTASFLHSAFCIQTRHSEAQRHRGLIFTPESNPVRRTCSIAIAILFCQGCDAPGADAAAKAATVPPGTPVAELIAEAGPPTLERTVDRLKVPNDLCAADSGAVRALDYEVPGKGFVRGVLEHLGKQFISSTVVVCVDSNQKVTLTHTFID
jgi:hypothetical protein